jgi:hypothetical protein
MMSAEDGRRRRPPAGPALIPTEGKFGNSAELEAELEAEFLAELLVAEVG